MGRTTSLLLVLGLLALLFTAPAAFAGPDEAGLDDAGLDGAAPADVAAAPAPVTSTTFDPWGCTQAPCGCDDYPCCTCTKPKEAKCPPKYNNRRFLENWRPCMCTPVCDLPDYSDRLKAMRLGRNIWVDVGGQIRFRWESFRNIAFGAAPDASDTWMLGRFRVHADMHFGDHFRAFVEGIYANQWERRELGPRPSDINEGDLLNAFVEGNFDFGNSNVGAWIGRRELLLGEQRLVSPLDWANTRRTFQGVGGWWKKLGHEVEAFWTHPLTIDAWDGDDWDEDRTFWGVNYKNDVWTCYQWEAYFFGLSDDATLARREQDRYTVGGLIHGKIPNTRFDYDAEAAYQFGEVGTEDISAYMFSGTFGWKPCAPVWDPRIGIGFDYASGDSDPTDGTNGTFNQLFPLAHKYLGHADMLARQNIVAARIEASVKPTPGLTLLAWYHMFWRADSADAAYFVTGGVLRPAGGISDTYIGSELDLMAKYKIDRHWVTFIEWAHFFPGSFIDAGIANEDIDVIYLGIQGTF